MIGDVDLEALYRAEYGLPPRRPCTAPSFPADFIPWRPLATMVLTTLSYACPTCKVSHKVDLLAPQGSPHQPVALACGACNSPCLLTEATHRPADVEGV